MKYLLLFCLLITANSNFADSWLQRADFPFQRSGAVSFNIGNKGYVGTGYKYLLVLYKDFWSYDPVSNTWTQVADVPGPERTEAFGFAIGNKGYVGAGNSSQDFYE